MGKRNAYWHARTKIVELLGPDYVLSIAAGGADLSATAARAQRSSEIISNTPSSSAPNPPQHRRQKTTSGHRTEADRAATVPSALAASDLIGTGT